MGGMQVQSIVAGIVVFVVSLALFQPMASGSDTLYREFVPRCEFNGETFIKLNNGKGEIAIVTQKSGLHSVRLLPPTRLPTVLGWTRVEPHDFQRALSGCAAQVIAGSWVTPHAALVEFGSINKLVLSLLPLVIVVGFMGTSFVSLYRNRNAGGGGIANAIKTEVGTLIVALIAIFVSPIALDFIGSASEVVTGETLNNTLTFGDIMELLFGFMPVGITLGIIALIGWRGYQSYKDMRGGSGGGGMM